MVKSEDSGELIEIKGESLENLSNTIKFIVCVQTDKGSARNFACRL